METRFFVIVPSYAREIGYKQNVFGPYSDFDKAQRVADVVVGEIVELPVTTLDEAIRILNQGDYLV